MKENSPFFSVKSQFLMVKPLFLLVLSQEKSLQNSSKIALAEEPPYFSYSFAPHRCLNPAAVAALKPLPVASAAVCYALATPEALKPEK